MTGATAKLSRLCGEKEEDAPPQKIGLALSGGGFRAAFFHVGVLARLAELGILPQVEVISTVSGGSIVGAAYYIRLKNLLETHADGEIGTDRYLELVEDVESCLLRAVQKNIRARVFANLFKNFAMARPNYSRSDRIGDLYDRYLYKEAWGKTREPRSLGRDKQIEMRELLIKPQGAKGFKPDIDNVGRQMKVPILLVNATSLNSGHNWRFEAVRMGEPLPEDPEHAEIVNEVDKSMRLEQGYFYPKCNHPQVPKPRRNFPLGLAVAASACVPGVFHPLAISGMYEGIRVQLVDGGVQDNQGLQGLFDQGCTHLIVSDASGQLDDKKKPAPLFPLVLKRSASIAGNRIRDEQLIDASTTYKYALMHLRKGLPDKVVAPGHSLEKAIEEGKDTVETDEFEVSPPVQAALSKIRTDLDFFSKTEAHSLELDGYLMSGYELGKKDFDELGSGDLPPVDASNWAFGEMKGKIGTADEDYLGQLEAGKKRFFRLFALRRTVAIGCAMVAAIVFAAIVCAVLGPIVDVLEGLPGWGIAVVVATAALVLTAPFLFVWANLSVLKAKLYPQ
jgi:NTE family protein